MSIHVKLTHVTHYRYDRMVGLSPHIVRLRPAPHCRTPILAYSQRITPGEHFLNWQQDPQSNYMARLVFPEKTRELKVEIDLVAELSVINPFDFFLEPSAEKFPFQYEPELKHDLMPYLAKLPATPRFAKCLSGINVTATPTVDFLVSIIQQLQNNISYLIRMEPGVQTPEETLTKLSGSCRDSSWLLVQLLRHLGLAARFVSGYLIQLTPDVKSLDGPSGTEVDFTDLHAWCEVYLPGAGWVGLDPTSGLFAGEGHIPLACTPEPSSAAPVFGFSDEAECEFEHIMKVERVWEAPRVTKPYTPEQWAAIEALGHTIDADLDNNDVRLTMGGEPTFVSVDDRDGDEWNTAADSPPEKNTKRLLGAELLHRLKPKYAPQGLLHYGQGKWYPGEQLPRWSLTCFWRKDGEPVWHNPEMIADEHKDYGADPALSARFLAEIADTLGVDAKYVFPAFEDTWYYLWRERKLPTNVDPFDAKLDDEMERKRLRKIFEQGLDKTVGHILPIAPALNRMTGAPRWTSGPWFLRAERCYLVPGDSPMGYRLPLDSMPWVSKGEYPYIHAIDQSAPQAPLPLYAVIRQQFQVPGAVETDRLKADAAAAASAAIAALDGTAPALNSKATTSLSTFDRVPAPNESASWITRTAMCVEARKGRLYIFMPPMQQLEDYLELVAAVESVAERLGAPVIIEGYEPPRDTRLESFRITPDPGVLEVNVLPSSSWEQMVDRTKHLYEQAHLTRLTSEKFMLDGRHTGTGGGNHFVLGGATVNDSPFLRRPDLLRSLISYWHNHPSLSYLFSGLFVGPTSQAPRIDEARNDSVYEMEIAFQQIPAPGNYSPPWLIDRILRNLLIDSSGNTHRSEFCIDKLFSPDGPTGRLGLLELRAFEMPPHAEMSLAQQLLLRGLIARFWQKPYAPERLTRWNTELHDRFMLPYFIDKDFNDVMTELQEFGYDFKAEWFAPHLEFRFPKYGSFSSQGAKIELRMALEPWHVMGEEGSSGGTVRYVDASVERLQVHVSGLASNRYVLTCNGRSVPLAGTGNIGEFVGAVRYKAWAPPSALHPTIGMHSPLVFDLVDTWMDRSMGGCTYYVAHPGGRNFETYPINAYEAEGRRLARYAAMGHTPGKITASKEALNPNFPFTLDLRR
ncbi:transglutaminase family protein [Uliginosibacterium sp. H3]|uniref:Transglutaminase family protein n=1 Tax=Uliginosibacterium silvisoli TaxID=3114758 RepID=A0ABU6K590_9RHOO|nr:transglutaminase family protein [Uliginosibacterium sp. H3]